MVSFNKVILAGRVTRDVVLRNTQRGATVTDVGIAINRRFRTDAGEIREETTFVDVIMWGRSAESAARVLSKGAGILVEGRLFLDTWDDRQTGQKRNRLRIVGERFQILFSPSSNHQNAPLANNVSLYDEPDNSTSKTYHDYEESDRAFDSEF